MMKISLERIRGSIHLVVIVLGLSLLNGCGGVEGGEPALEGVFLDGPVSGLNFKTASQAGITDKSGKFQYKQGEDITFSVREIILGSTKAKPIITPTDLASGTKSPADTKVSNIAIFLQTLDHDGNINNGIQIPYGIDPIITETLAENGPIDFTQNTKKFLSDRALNSLLEELNTVQTFAENTTGAIRQMVPVEDARIHLKINSSKRKRVATTYGKINGFELDDRSWAWFGVPYAQPPLGQLRWRAPKPPEPWFGTLDTSAHSMPCPQQVHDANWQPGSQYIGSEDCLYLDIYRPKTDKTDLPVYVWIHGGINNFGSSRDYDGSFLAKRGNLIVVVVQYRLGVLGWFTHPSLREDVDKFDASGNYGMLDQLAALKWIKDNISAFGGDPENVTLGGQSGGGHNILNLMTSPTADGLFDKAVVQSASMEHRTIEQGDREADQMIDWLLIDDETEPDAKAAAMHRAHMGNAELKNYLSSKTAAKIIDACRLGTGNGILPAHSAFTDGALVPQNGWLQTIKSGKYHHMPLLIGNNEDEFKNILPLYGEFLNNRFPSVPSGSYTWSSIFLVLDGNLLSTSVFPTPRDKEFYDMIGTLKSRIWKATYVDSIARTFKAQDATMPVYAYRFDWSGGGDSVLSDFKFIFGATHAMEIPFFFGTTSKSTGYAYTEANTQGRVALQDAMMDYLCSFITFGDPNHSNSKLLKWPQWSNNPNNPKFIVLNANLSNVELSVSSEEEKLSKIFKDISAAQEKFNTTGELGYMDYFGLRLPEE